jgi:hypothetical protein
MQTQARASERSLGCTFQPNECEFQNRKYLILFP